MHYNHINTVYDVHVLLLHKHSNFLSHTSFKFYNVVMVQPVNCHVLFYIAMI